MPRTIALIDLNAGETNRAVPLLKQLIQVTGGEPRVYDARPNGPLPGVGHAAYVLTGGPGAPTAPEPWRDRLLPLCQRWRAPVLGICLGFQVLAVAHGWRVRLTPHPRFGLYPLPPTRAGRGDPLLSRVTDDGVIFEQRLWAVLPPRGPARPGAALLSVDVDGEVLAARLSRWAVGTTFHPEASTRAVRNWLDVDQQARDLLRQRQGAQALQQLPARVQRLRSPYDTIIPGFLARALGTR